MSRAATVLDGYDRHPIIVARKDPAPRRRRFVLTANLLSSMGCVAAVAAYAPRGRRCLNQGVPTPRARRLTAPFFRGKTPQAL